MNRRSSRSCAWPPRGPPGARLEQSQQRFRSADIARKHHEWIIVRTPWPLLVPALFRGVKYSSDTRTCATTIFATCRSGASSSLIELMAKSSTRSGIWRRFGRQMPNWERASASVPSCAICWRHDTGSWHSTSGSTRNPQRFFSSSGPRRRRSRRSWALPRRRMRATPSRSSLWHRHSTMATPRTSTRRCEAYRRALEIDPYLVPALINLANIHYARNEMAEAQALYERAIALEPDVFESHFNLGNIFHDLGRLHRGAGVLSRSAPRQPVLRGRALLPGGVTREERACHRRRDCTGGLSGARAERRVGSPGERVFGLNAAIQANSQ